MAAYMTEEEFCFEQGRIRRIEQEVKRLDAGLGEQGQAVMELRLDVRHDLDAIRGQIEKMTRDIANLAMYVRMKEETTNQPTRS